MTSLAEQLRNRHVDERVNGSGDGQPSQAAPAAQGLSDPAGPVSSAGASLGGLRLTDLPQLRSSGSSAGSATFVPPKWGAALASASSPATADSSVGSAWASPKASPKGSPGPRISAGQTSSLTANLEVPESKPAVVAAVRDVSQKFGVKIEVAYSATPNNAIFMLKGASSDKLTAALRELEASLQPHERVEVIIPSSARALVIGSKGQTLRGLENTYKVRIDLSVMKMPSPWSVERSVVLIEGPTQSVAEASKAIVELVDFSRQISSTREVPADVLAFLQHNKAYDSAHINTANNRVTLQGAFDQLLQQMEQIDALTEEVRSEYVRQALSNSTERISTELAREIYNSTGAVLLSGEIVGPQQAAVDKANKLLQQYLTQRTQTRFDISQAHGRDISHARMLARYFAAKDEMSSIAAQCGDVFISPEPDTDGEKVEYVIEGEKKAVSRARVALKNAVMARGPSAMCVIRGMRHPLVRKRAALALDSLQGPVSGFIGPSDELFLEYCEPEDDFAPSSEDIEQHIENARMQLAPLSDLAAGLTKRKFVLPLAEVVFVSNPRGPQATELWTKVLGTRDDIVFMVENAGNDEFNVYLDGTKTAVSEAAEELPRIILLSKQHAIRASHVQEFDVQPTLVRNLIGRSGTQIQKFRDEFDAKVEVNEAGHVRVQGVEGQAKACAKAINDFVFKLSDEVTEKLDIPSEFHAKLIGPKGKHTRRLGEQHQCTIRFPKADDSANDEVIVLRGPSRGVAAIKREFMDLVNYERANSYTETITAPRSVVRRLVGRGGVGINSIRHATNTDIDVASPQTDSEEEQIKITVKGEQKNVKAAVSKLRQSVESMLDIVDKTLDVPQKYHRFLTGSQNAKRRDLVANAGGDATNANRVLSIPPLNSTKDANLVRLSGPSKVVIQLEEQIVSLLAEYERRSQVVGQLTVPRDRLRRVIGLEWAKVKETEEKFDVLLDIPRGSDNAPAVITVTGETQEKVDSALDHLRDLALPEERIVKIPSALWSSRLRNQVNSMANAQLNIKGSPQVQATPARPRDIDFVVTSSPLVELRLMSKTAEDEKKVSEHLEKLGTMDSIGYLWVAPNQLPSIVGPGGRTIKKVRAETGCDIDVPNANSVQPVTIAGTKQGVEAAKEAIMLALKK